MTSQDDLTLLKQMHQRGEITDAQYDVLRRHVLWGTPLPQLADDLPAPRPSPEQRGGYVPGAGTVGPDRNPDAGDVRHAPGRYAGDPAGGRQAGDPGGGPTAPRGGRYAGDPDGGRYAGEPGGGRYAGDPDGGRYAGEPGGGRHAGEAPRRYASRRERREAEEAGTYARLTYLPDPPPTQLPPMGGTPRHRHRKAEPPDDAPTAEPAGRRREAEAGNDSGRGRERRRPHRRSVIAVLTSVLLALALAAGGVYWFVLRTSGQPPAAYARQACGSVRDWQQVVHSSNATLIDQISRQEDKTKVRAAVTTYYTTIAGRTDLLRSALLGLKPADLPGGRDYAGSLAAAVGDEATALRRLAARAAELDPAAATFRTDLQGLLTGADTAVGAVTVALARPSAGITTDIRTALSNDPTCAPYVG
jgi:hypothetical protein